MTKNIFPKTASTSRLGAQEIIRLINDYARANYALFKVINTPEGKKIPAAKGWRNTQPDLLIDAKSLGETYGINLQKDDLVVDVDPRRYKGDNSDTFESFCKKFNIKIDTLIVQSGGVDGGFHVYYKKPSEIGIKHSIPGFPAIEFKTAGQFVIGAGSLHRSGNQYKIIRGDIKQIAKTPKELIELLAVERKEALKVEVENPLDEEELCAAEKRFENYCLYTQAADIGGRNNKVYEAACEARDYGLPEEFAFKQIQEILNARFEMPLDDNELESTVQHAYEYAKNSEGSRRADVVFKDVELEVEPCRDIKTSLSISIFSAAELMKEELADQLWVIDQLLPVGLTVFAGAPKSGKSFFVLSLAMAISSGDIALGCFQATQGKVLYLALEDNKRRLKNRLEKLSLDSKRKYEDLMLTCACPKFDDKGLQELQKWLKQNPDCKLLVIDTYARFSPKKTNTQNAYDFDYFVMGELQKFALSNNVALILVTHNRKQPSSDDLGQIMGSTAITGAADVVWKMERRQGVTSGVLKITGRDVEEMELALNFEKHSCQWTALGDAHAFKVGSERQAIIRCLKQSNEPLGPKEVAAEIGGNPLNIKNLMRKMFQRGQLIKPRYGKYQVNDDFDFSTL